MYRSRVSKLSSTCPLPSTSRPLSVSGLTRIRTYSDLEPILRADDRPDRLPRRHRRVSPCAAQRVDDDQPGRSALGQRRFPKARGRVAGICHRDRDGRTVGLEPDAVPAVGVLEDVLHEGRDDDLRDGDPFGASPIRSTSPRRKRGTGAGWRGGTAVRRRHACATAADPQAPTRYTPVRPSEHRHVAGDAVPDDCPLGPRGDRTPG